MRLSKTLVITSAVIGLVASGFYADVQAKPRKLPKTTQKVVKVQIAKTYNDIDKMIDYGNYAAADRLLNNLLKKNPNDISARSLYIISLVKQDKFDVAQSQLNKYLPKFSKNANLHYAQGVLLVKRQASSDMEYREKSEELLKRAQNEFNTALIINPRYYQTYNALGVIELNTGNWNKARQYFGRALEVDPNYATAIDNLGTVDYLQGNHDLAQKRFMKAISLNPNSSTAYFHLAQVYDKKSGYSKALDALDHSLRIKGNSSVAYNLRGEILKKQGNEVAAIESFKKSIALKPENTKPYVNLAKIYERRFDNELAIASLKSALAVNPAQYSVKLKVGELSLLKGDYNESLKYYSSLVGVEGYNADALKGMANAYFAQVRDTASKSVIANKKELQTAYNNIEKALQANPNDLDLYLAKLKMAKLTNKEKATQETLDKIVKAPVRGLNDLLAKGDAYYAMNKYQEAKKTFEKSVVFAESLDDYLYVAEILTYDKFYPSAKDVLRKALIVDPTNEEAVHNLNYIMNMERQSESLYKDAKFFQKKDKNRVFAREYALKALDYNPTNYDAALLSAKLCEKQKHYVEAIDAYKVVAGLEIKPRKIKKMNKKIIKLEKKLAKIDKRYMKKENKEFKKCQDRSTLSL
ncbi:MAG: hypothetical protein DKM24_03390 [Candidatus Melainabacteria bacterium]|nr:MAG: hypothetical protein DKM24_03390 [Candidatus Melainabacteria bacterium]